LLARPPCLDRAGKCLVEKYAEVNNEQRAKKREREREREREAERMENL